MDVSRRRSQGVRPAVLRGHREVNSRHVIKARRVRDDEASDRGRQLRSIAKADWWIVVVKVPV
jgi:hypothetical protein